MIAKGCGKRALRIANSKEQMSPANRERCAQLVAMHECFASLTATMEHTGTLQNESRELERRIEQEEARANVLNMAQVIQDLEEIKAENYALSEHAGLKPVP